MHVPALLAPYWLQACAHFAVCLFSWIFNSTHFQYSWAYFENIENQKCKKVDRPFQTVVSENLNAHNCPIYKRQKVTLNAKHIPHNELHIGYINCCQNLRPVFAAGVAALYFLQWRLRILCPDADERRTPLERLNCTTLGPTWPLSSPLCTRW